MNWTHSPALSAADTGAMAIEENGLWQSYPYGIDGGCSGEFASREDAIQVAESVVAATSCAPSSG